MEKLDLYDFKALTIVARYSGDEVQFILRELTRERLNSVVAQLLFWHKNEWGAGTIITFTVDGGEILEIYEKVNGCCNVGVGLHRIAENLPCKPSRLIRDLWPILEMWLPLCLHPVKRLRSIRGLIAKKSTSIEYLDACATCTDLSDGDEKAALGNLIKELVYGTPAPSAHAANSHPNPFC